MKQVDAVIAIVSGIDGFVPGVKLNKEQKEECLALITQGLLSGDIDMSAGARAKHDTPEKMRTYSVGLLDNWVRKAPELNGGVKYVAKNPGSRSGSSEYKQAVALKKYLTEKGHPIPSELEAFIAANAPVKTEKTVDISALPEHLQKLVG
jgi:ribosomal protein S18